MRWPGHTSSVTHAPPRMSRRSTTQTRRPGPREVGAGGEPVVAPADDDRVVVGRMAAATYAILTM